MLRKYLVSMIAVVAVSLPLSTAWAGVVKKSNSGICHDEYSSYYSRTKNYTPFNSLAACLDSGGRLPKSYKGKRPTPNQSTAKAATSSSQGYSRKAFGSGWADLNKDCQNSRMEALIAQSLQPVQFKSSKGCKVKSGRWISPFSGKTIYEASKIDIDHVVPLSWAWKHGANSWSKSKRVKFANDPANLLSVEASLNRQKGDKGLDVWLPPKNKCQYIARFQRVYKTYGLTLSNGEKAAYSNLSAVHCGS